ncbi:hypothetical protein [Sphingobium chungangianum]
MTVPGTRPSAGQLLWVIALILILAALRASYAVTMPILFAAIIVAALWPLKLWLDKRLPSWLSWLTVATLVIILTAFVAAVYLSLGQLMSVLSAQWSKLVSLYDAAANKARDWVSHSTRGCSISNASWHSRRCWRLAFTVSSLIQGSSGCS